MVSPKKGFRGEEAYISERVSENWKQRGVRKTSQLSVKFKHAPAPSEAPPTNPTI